LVCDFNFENRKMVERIRRKIREKIKKKLMKRRKIEQARYREFKKCEKDYNEHPELFRKQTSKTLKGTGNQGVKAELLSRGIPTKFSKNPIKYL
jgi:hypothetical protein